MLKVLRQADGLPSATGVLGASDAVHLAATVDARSVHQDADAEKWAGLELDVPARAVAPSMLKP